MGQATRKGANKGSAARLCHLGGGEGGQRGRRPFGAFVPAVGRARRAERRALIKAAGCRSRRRLAVRPPSGRACRYGLSLRRGGGGRREARPSLLPAGPGAKAAPGRSARGARARARTRVRKVRVRMRVRAHAFKARDAARGPSALRPSPSLPLSRGAPGLKEPPRHRRRRALRRGVGELATQPALLPARRRLPPSPPPPPRGGRAPPSGPPHSVPSPWPPPPLPPPGPRQVYKHQPRARFPGSTSPPPSA